MGIEQGLAMAADWYFKISGEEVGPLSARQLRAMAEQGKLIPTDEIRQGIAGAWVAAGRIKGLFPDKPATPSSAEVAELPTARPVRPSADSTSAARPAVSRAVKPLDVPVARAAPQPPATPEPRQAADLGHDPIHAGSDSASPPPGATRRKKKRNNVTTITVLGVMIVGLAVVAAVLPGLLSNTPSTSAKPASSRAGATTDQTATAASAAEPDPMAAKPDLAADSPQKPAEVAWVHASEPVVCGKARIRIASATIGMASLVKTSGEPVANKVECLLIAVDVENDSPVLNIEYASWNVRGPSGPKVKLTDNLGGGCAQLRFRDAKVEGQLEGQAIGPKKTAHDVLVFMKPAGEAQSLRLELSAAAVGEQGTLNIEIPPEMIVAKENPDGSLERVAEEGPAPDTATGSPRAAAPGAMSSGFDVNIDPDGDITQISKDIEELGPGGEEAAERAFSTTDGFQAPAMDRKPDEGEKAPRE